uniref:ORF2 n=1 Tax=anatid alphaherpesvirus 1 TaxID=104388 RepID=C4PEF4_9ALPH|nr:ORF2 [Anatid alphaherpesvirus 1]
MQLVHHIYSTNISIDYIFIICHVDGLVRARPRPGEALDPPLPFPGPSKKGGGAFLAGGQKGRGLATCQLHPLGGAWAVANPAHNKPLPWEGLGSLPTPPMGGAIPPMGGVRVGRVPKVLRY